MLSTTSSRAGVLLAFACVTALLLGVAGPSLADDSTPTARPPADARPTVFGQTIPIMPGESYPLAVQRATATYGPLGAIRSFNTEPTTWTPKRFDFAFGDRDGVISFGGDPADVLAGRYDDAYRSFFATAPTDRPTWWSYLHEADLAHEEGRLPDLAQYRVAFAHVAQLARQAHNPMLRTTVVLFGYTGNPRAQRAVTDYWPGDDLTDTIAWDVYNGWSTRQGLYGTTRPLEYDREASEAVGKPWALAEFGSVVVPGDDGTGRAAWLTDICRYAHDNGAQFAMYFDSNSGGKGADYRLTDQPSTQAWRDALDGSLFAGTQLAPGS